MDELLVYGSELKLRYRQLAAGVIVVGVVGVAVSGALEIQAVHWVLGAIVLLIAVATIAAFERRIRRPLPELRLSTEGIEGAFGLVFWDDVLGAELLMRVGLPASGIVLRLHDPARVAPPTRDFVKVRKEIQKLSPDRLRLETTHLELKPRDLLREIERYRLYAVGSS